MHCYWNYQITKYFIVYLYNDHRVKPLHKILPKTSSYVKSYDGQTKWLIFLIEDVNVIEKYYTIWDKASANITK